MAYQFYHRELTELLAELKNFSDGIFEDDSPRDELEAIAMDIDAARDSLAKKFLQNCVEEKIQAMEEDADYMSAGAYWLEQAAKELGR